MGDFLKFLMTNIVTKGAQKFGDFVGFLKNRTFSKKPGVTIAQWIRLSLPSAALGSSPKHTIYAFII